MERLEHLDPAAFEALYRRWQGRVVPYLRRLVGDAGTAEDLFQETFLRALEGRGRHPPGATSFPGWLYRVATRLGLDALRSRRRHPTEPLEVEPAGAEPPAEARAEEKELREELRRAVAELPAGLRTVFLLRAQQGLPYAEIAGALEVSEEAVRSRMFHARRRLLARLGPWMETRR